MLEVKNLSKKYLNDIDNKKTTIKEIITDNLNPNTITNISFNVAQNEIFAILGENGSGKSTLLKLIAGLLQPDFGTISLDNVLVVGPEFKLIAGVDNIKLIHQNYNLFPNKSVRDNILYAMRFYSKEYQSSKLIELLSLCNLEKIAAMLPKQISGGEQQRTAIAAALSTPTDLLLLDEPFSNLDVFNKEALKIYIKNIGKTTSIIYVTHDAQEALSVADKIVVVKNGQLKQIDTPYNSYNFPMDIYVAQITGLVNILESNMLKQNVIGKTNTMLGIRPENISFGNIDDFDIIATIKTVTYLGAQYLVLLTTNEMTEIMVYSKNSFLLNEKVFLKLDKNKIIKW